MIFNGTAQELADLTRAFWAADWWPDGLDCAGITATCEGRTIGHDVLWCLKSPDFAIDEADEEGEEWKREAIPTDDRVEQAVLPLAAEHAASIIFAAAFEFVSIRGLAVPLLWRDFKDENKWAAIIWGRLCEGPSPLHAILGAALEAAR